MRIIAITSPAIIGDDAYIIASLLDRGVDTIHLRKPAADIDECRALLSTLSAEHRARIVIHDYPELYSEFSLKGIHQNRNVVTLPENYSGFRTCSCHTLDEVVRYKHDCDYLFLSPIFDSISKLGYKSQFDHCQLRRACDAGVIDDRVVALGGVTFDKIEYLASLGFGGVAMSGALYSVDALKNMPKIY